MESCKGKEKVNSNSQKSKTTTPSPPKPQLPFPQRFKKEVTEKYKALFDQQLQGIELKLPLVDAFMLIPPYQKFLKDTVKERTREVEDLVFLTHEASAIIQSTPINDKHPEPGTLTIPCSIGNSSFKNCVCDLGASICLMPLFVAQSLGRTNLKPCRISIVLADRSVRKPVGWLENIPVRVGGMDILTDFIVLDMGPESFDPLLFGRPFLATAGAIINVPKGEIKLNLGKDLQITFNVNDVMGKPDTEERILWVESEESDTLVKDYLEAQEEEDELLVVLKGKADEDLTLVEQDY